MPPERDLDRDWEHRLTPSSHSKVVEAKDGGLFVLAGRS